MGINYSVVRAQEWEARIRELEPKLPPKHADAIGVAMSRLDQAQTNVIAAIIDAGLDHESFEAEIRKLDARNLAV